MKTKIVTIVSFLSLCIIDNSLASRKLNIISEIANIRSGPGTSYEIMWKAEQYYPISVLKKRGNWYLFRDFEGDTGWVHKSLLGSVNSVVVIKNKCNIRSGPSTKNRILFTVEKGVPFKIIDKRGNWLKVEHADGDRGWIYKTLVKKF